MVSCSRPSTRMRYGTGTSRQRHDQLRAHLDAYNFAKRLKTLKGLTPYEQICKIWTE